MDLHTILKDSSILALLFSESIKGIISANADKLSSKAIKKLFSKFNDDKNLIHTELPMAIAKSIYLAQKELCEECLKNLNQYNNKNIKNSEKAWYYKEIKKINNILQQIKNNDFTNLKIPTVNSIRFLLITDPSFSKQKEEVKSRLCKEIIQKIICLMNIKVLS